MKGKLLILLAFFGMVMTVQAETKEERMQRKHEIRVGWGDQLFESLVWHDPTHYELFEPTQLHSYNIYKEDYSYDQHIWAEYNYRHNEWFSCGIKADVSDVRWHNVWRDGAAKELYRDSHQYFYNIVLTPTIRFTYLHLPYFNMYSALGLGLGINGGSEEDNEGKSTAFGTAADIILLGFSANYNQWFLTVDYGGLYSIKNMNTIFMAKSRMISIGLGVRF